MQRRLHFRIGPALTFTSNKEKVMSPSVYLSDLKLSAYLGCDRRSLKHAYSWHSVPPHAISLGHAESSATRHGAPISDRLRCSTSFKIRLYADNCVLHETINTIDNHCHLVQSLMSSCAWCKTWQMNINCSKTVVMSFTNWQSPFVLTILWMALNLKKSAWT